jgi:imidazolonepropionase-like amidohydrolase
VRQSEDEQKKERDQALTALEDALNDARAYRTARMSGDGQHLSDLRWEAMMPVFTGELPVFVSANDIQEIQAAVAWADREGLKLIIQGGADAWRVSDLLAARHVPVVVTGTHRMPSRRWEDFDAPFTVPAKLYKAGVKFCISSGMSWGGTPTAASTRNLPYHAATAAAYGLPPEEALKAVTIYAAEILGIADRAGALAVGMDATLIITDGDPLEIPTHVERMFIEGRDIDLTSRHTMLYEKYRTKYSQP